MSSSESHSFGADVLDSDFPGMLTGEAFERHIEGLAQQTPRFAVLVVSIDDFEKKLKDFGETLFLPRLIQLPRVLADMNPTGEITWGRLGPHVFSLFCPNLGEEAAVDLAKALQRRYANATDETVSVGLAVYPFGPFEPVTILENAWKALAHASFFGARTVTPFDAVSLNISADKLYQNGDVEGAIAEYETAAGIDPGNLNVYNSLGVCYGVQGDLDKAIGAFETAVAISPEDVMATYNLGLTYLKQKKRNRALELFLRARSLDGQNPDIAGHIGMSYQEMGEIDNAIIYLEEAVERISVGSGVFRALADCYVAKEDFRNAAKFYERAIKASPRDAKSLNSLAHVYGILGENLEIAIVLAEESVSIAGDNGLYQRRLGELYMKRGDYEKARATLAHAHELGHPCHELIEEVRTKAQER